MADSTVERRKEKFKNWLKNPAHLGLVALIAFTVILRLYYFFVLKDQPIWWDEGDYLAIAKVWAIGQSTPEWWGHFTTMRPLLLPIIWAALFKVGFSELFLRFTTLLIPSILLVYLTYLVGKELYNKYIGLIAGLVMSVYWVALFYSFRLLTDIPAALLGMLSFYFFWKYYVKQKKPFGLYLCLLFGVLAFSTRFPLALVPVTCALFMLITQKLKVFTDKTVWKSLGVLLLLMVPYLIFFISTDFYFLQFYFGDKAVSIKEPLAWYTIGMFPSLLHGVFLALFIAGLITLIPLLLGLDVVWKQKDKSLNADLFVLLWIVVHLVFYVGIIRGSTDRWLLMLMPALFIVGAKGLVAIYDLLKKYHKHLAIIVVLLLLGATFYQQINHGHNLIMQKKDTYQEVKLGGLWLKDNTSPDVRVMTASIVQNQYYSERQSYDFRTNDTIWESCTDLYGAVSTNETCQALTEAAFNKKVAELKPEYFIASVFEPVFTPQWVYTYGEKHNLTVSQAYFDQNNRPVLIIYQF